MKLNKFLIGQLVTARIGNRTIAFFIKGMEQDDSTGFWFYTDGDKWIGESSLTLR